MLYSSAPSLYRTNLFLSIFLDVLCIKSFSLSKHFIISSFLISCRRLRNTTTLESHHLFRPEQPSPKVSLSEARSSHRDSIPRCNRMCFARTCFYGNFNQLCDTMAQSQRYRQSWRIPLPAPRLHTSCRINIILFTYQGAIIHYSGLNTILIKKGILNRDYKGKPVSRLALSDF